MKDHILYKGEYYKSPVAIKVFKNPMTINTNKVREIFEEEIRTLKRLESSYIVRLYGICIDESGTLREVLRKEQDLPWKIRCDMASDAAAGLYSCQDLNWTKQSRPSVKKAKIKSPGSFGIVLWEIATGKLPFTEIYKKVYKQKVQEPLGEDCPSYLQTIINQCRSYNPSKRPTTEVIVNQLLIDQDDNSSNLTS
ncbi:Mixed lineage kinase domain-like protein, partial [Ophiophagus hannah]